MFSDVHPGDSWYAATNGLYQAGITVGCSTTPLQFCPTDSLLRYQMAIFIVRAWSVATYGNPEAFMTAAPPSTTPHFTDVSNSDCATNAYCTYNYIQKLWELGITGGCSVSPALFCPNDGLQNYQVAIFVARTKQQIDFPCSTPGCMDTFSFNSSAYFADVPASYTYFKWIQRVAGLGIVSPLTSTPGCTIGNFCPTSSTQRGEMAIYTYKGLLATSSSTIVQTVKTLPAGFSVTVDGINYTSAQTFLWTAGSSHTVSVSYPTVAPYFMSSWSDAGAQSHTISATQSTLTANYATIAGPGSLHVNLGYVSFVNYDTAHLASANGFVGNCPDGSSVRSCFQTILFNMRAQGVTGVRVFLPLCEGDPSISPITGCGNLTSGVSFSATSGPGQLWIQKAGDFFNDVKNATDANGVGIRNVTITLVHGTPAGAPTNGGIYGFPVSKAAASSPAGPCSTAPDTIYFWPSLPYGITGPPYFPIGQGEPNSAGYNCAPMNPYFIGWTNQFNAINALLAAAVGKVNINELETEQEISLVEFPVQLRYIYDNVHAGSYNQAYTNCNSNPSLVDNVCILRTLMSNNGFDPGGVNWSAQLSDATNSSQNCSSVYGDFARQINLGAIASAFGGGYIGLATASVPMDGLHCGGGSTSGMYQVPIYHTQPNMYDQHMYPHVEPAQPTDTEVQTVATLAFSDFLHFLNIVSNPSALVMVGETHIGTYSNAAGCDTTPFPPLAAANTVAGFNASMLAGHSVVLRPWMELQNSPVDAICFRYPTYQNVNLNGAGPYSPTIR